MVGTYGGIDIAGIEQTDYERYVGLILNAERTATRAADIIRNGVSACLIEAFGGVRPIEFFLAAVNDEDFARFLHSKAMAMAESEKINAGGK